MSLIVEAALTVRSWKTLDRVKSEENQTKKAKQTTLTKHRVSGNGEGVGGGLTADQSGIERPNHQAAGDLSVCLTSDVQSLLFFGAFFIFVWSIFFFNFHNSLFIALCVLWLFTGIFNFVVGVCMCVSRARACVLNMYIC